MGFYRIRAYLARLEIQACSEFFPAIAVRAVRENSPNRGGQPFGDLNLKMWDSRSGSWFREKPDAADMTHTFLRFLKKPATDLQKSRILCAFAVSNSSWFLQSY